jgi:hypothetical protein
MKYLPYGKCEIFCFAKYEGSFLQSKKQFNKIKRGKLAFSPFVPSHLPLGKYFTFRKAKYFIRRSRISPIPKGMDFIVKTPTAFSHKVA